MTVSNSALKKINHTPLTPVQRKLCDETAVMIRRFETEAMTAIAEIGSELIKVKNVLGHGRFGKWLKDEVNYTARTAQNYMNAAQAFGEKYETVSNLPKTTIYDLAALPDAERTEIVALINDPENPPVKTIKDKIASHRRAGAQAKAKKAREDEEAAKDAKRSPAAKKARKAKREKEEAEHKARIEKRDKEEAQTKRMAAQLAGRMGPDMVAELLVIIKRHGGWVLEEELQAFLTEHKEVVAEIDELVLRTAA